MMKDSDIEDLLKKFRPTGPPAELRARILASRRLPLTWPWWSAAAALLILTLRLQRGVQEATSGTQVEIGPSSVSRVTDDLSERLGGDLRARGVAEFIVLEQQIRSELMPGSAEFAAATGALEP